VQAIEEETMSVIHHIIDAIVTVVTAPFRAIASIFSRGGGGGRRR